MKLYICLMMLFGAASAFCSDIDFKWHSWDEAPEEGQLYIILASEYGFDRDCQGTFILQIWGCEDPYLCHQHEWLEANQEMQGQPIDKYFLLD